MRGKQNLHGGILRCAGEQNSDVMEKKDTSLQHGLSDDEFDIHLIDNV
jgi:hypothetical protein